MAKKRKVGNLLALAVLSYLTQRPMHPYELSRTLRDNNDVRSIKFNHGSLYMVVGQLARAGFIAEQETSRERQRPERTLYALTDAGRHELHDWLRELVEQRQHEYPHFVATLSLIAIPRRWVGSRAGCPGGSAEGCGVGCGPVGEATRWGSGKVLDRRSDRLGVPLIHSHRPGNAL